MSSSHRSSSSRKSRSKMEIHLDRLVNSHHQHYHTSGRQTRVDKRPHTTRLPWNATLDAEKGRVCDARLHLHHAGSHSILHIQTMRTITAHILHPVTPAYPHSTWLCIADRLIENSAKRSQRGGKEDPSSRRRPITFNISACTMDSSDTQDTLSPEDRAVLDDIIPVCSGCAMSG